MAISVPDLGDVQSYINSIDESISSTDLIKLQLSIGLLMMRITAVSGIVKSFTDSMQGIASKFS